jgi:flagellar biosynthesis protein FlhB
MASERSFPPSARRLALARAAGLTPASPLLVGALAGVGAAVALAAIGSAIATRLGAWARAAIASADGARVGDALAATGATDSNALAPTSATTGDALAPTGTIATALDAARTVHAAHAADAAHAAQTADAARISDATLWATAFGTTSDVVHAILSLALPVLAAIAIAAIVGHLAQTRAVWLPRRKLPNAPAEDPQRGMRGALAVTNGIVVGLVTVVWLFAMAPRIAVLFVVDRADAGALLVLSFIAALAIAWVVLGTIDALVRFASHTRSLRMTPEEQREDQRLAGADPRWRARREKLARGEPVRDAIAGASVLVLGDGVAVAVAWDPVRRPVPTRTASGRAARATQLLGLARRHSIAVHRDAELATLLATGEGPVPDQHWSRLAEIIAAVRAR